MPKKTYADIAIALLDKNELELASDVLTLAEDPSSVEPVPDESLPAVPTSDAPVDQVETPDEVASEEESEDEPEPLLTEEEPEIEETEAVLKGEALYEALEQLYDAGKGGEVNGIQVDSNQAEVVLTVADQFKKQCNRERFLNLPIKDLLQKAEQLAY